MVLPVLDKILLAYIECIITRYSVLCKKKFVPPEEVLQLLFTWLVPAKTACLFQKWMPTLRSIEKVCIGLA